MAGCRKLAALAALVAVAAATGCTTLPSLEPGPVIQEADSDRLVPATHAAVDRLLASLLPGKEFVRGQPVIVATVVNIDDLKGSRLGRVLAEQFGTRLTQQGYSVVELKLRGSIFVKKSEGELLLSREIQDLTLNQRAQAVLVGTYAEAKGFVYVTMKLVEAATGQAIAACDFALPVDRTVHSMLSRN